MKRGIFGGTFDPPHIAHLLAGEAAYRQLSLDVVTFIPAGDPWQKADESVSGAEHRLRMTRLAVRDVPYFEVDDIEIRREGATYTIDTVESFDADDLVLILGADAALGLRTWHRWRELVGLVEMAVAPRPGIGRHEVERAVPKPVTWLDMSLLDVSSTELRRRAESGSSIRFYVSEGTWGYVEETSLYG